MGIDNASVFLCEHKHPDRDGPCYKAISDVSDRDLQQKAWTHFWEVHAAQIMDRDYPPIGHSINPMTGGGTAWMIAAGADSESVMVIERYNNLRRR